jgi:hypothetical protein
MLSAREFGCKGVDAHYKVQLTDFCKKRGEPSVSMKVDKFTSEMFGNWL